MFSPQRWVHRLLVSLIVATALFSVLAARLRADQAVADDTVADSDGTSPATFDLRPNPEDQQTSRVRLQLEVGGHLTVAGQSDVQKLPMSVVADMAYEEQFLSTGSTRRSVRYYERSDVVIKVGKSTLDEELVEDRRLILARLNDVGDEAGPRITLVSPVGPLTRDQLDLIDIVGSSLVLPDLLPDEPVVIGQPWQQTQQAIAALVRLEAVSHCDVQSTIDRIDGDQVSITLSGVVSGASEGVGTEISLKAKYRFDLTERRIREFNLAVEEKRPIGHASPGVDVVAKLNMRIDPLPQPKYLTETVLAELPPPFRSTELRLTDHTTTTAKASPKETSTQLRHQLSGGRWQLAHDRRWYVAADEPRLTILRLIDRGDLVAQCNVRPLATKSPERHLTLEEFQHDVQFALGNRMTELVSAGQWEDDRGHRVFRVVARGKVEELPIEWRSYLVAHRDGHRINFTFTVEGPLADRLGQADRRLVSSIEYIVSEPSAKQPEPSAKETEPSAKQPEPSAKETEPPAKEPEPPVKESEPVAKEPESPAKPVTTAAQPKRGRSVRLRR